MSAPAEALKQEVKAFWNRQSCDTQYAASEKFSREYFEQIEQWRYSDQPFIHSFAQFTRYRGKRVLEVGFGAGTDFIQWLRAGAVASGVDLTEEALENLKHRVAVYGLPEPEALKVADAENLPFAKDSFDLGYSWGVLHHTPDTERAIAEVVRVVRPGGEIKLMLYNRHSLYAAKIWARHALLAGKPWKGFGWAIWNHVESLGTKAYTRREVQRIMTRLGTTEVQVQTFLTGADRIVSKSLARRLCGIPLAIAGALTGTRLGWFHGITARKT